MGTYNVYKHEGAETAQYKLEIIISFKVFFFKYASYSFDEIRPDRLDGNVFLLLKWSNIFT